MASEILNLSALCRCCHIDGTFRLLDNTYNFNGQIENYSSMLIECFGLLLSQPTIEASHTICDVCIEKLRNALEFKKQVEQCEKKFENYCKNEILLQSKMRIECSSDYEVTIKPEIQIEIEDSYGHSPIHEYPELDSCKVSDDEENLNHDDGTENTDVKQCYLETDKPPSIPPHLNHKEPQLKEKHKINYLETETPKSNRLKVTNKNVKQVTKKNKSSSQQKITNIRCDNGLKEEKLYESGPEKIQIDQYASRSGGKRTCNRKVYTCLTCKGSFKYRQSLRGHMQFKHSIFMCSYPSCNITFSTKELILDHRLRTHKSSECNVCGKTFKSRNSMSTHVNSHLKTKVYKCDVCNKEFHMRCILIKHLMRLHTEIPCAIARYICDACGHVANDLTSLKWHIINVHEKLKLFKCDQCPKEYASKKNLKIHYRKHTGERPFQCQECGQAFRAAYNLTVHMRRHAGKTVTDCGKKKSSQATYVRFTCKVCGKGFHRKASLALHTWTHAGSKPFKCDYCEKDFICKYSQRRHMELHQPGGPAGVPCEICHKKFSTKATMLRHMRTVHDSSAGRYKPKVKCTFCNRRVRDLEKHMNVHSNKFHHCEFCPKSYSERNVLNQHIKARHSGTSNDCKLCDKKFVQLRTLQKHVLKKHSIQSKVKNANENCEK